ncbi:MAG: prolyl oligopeptidase family serine peptidase [Thermomonas sp.]
MSINRVALAALLACLACMASAVARVHEVEEGETPQLEAGEGLLLLEVDTDLPLTGIDVSARGESRKSAGFGKVPVGQAVKLFVVRAGRYRWTRIDTSLYTRMSLAGDEEYEFDVVAGRINYPGDLLYRWTGYLTAEIERRNRGLRVIDWLQAKHPGVFQRYPFEFAGHYPDPFPAFYATELAGMGSAVPATEPVGAVPPAPVRMPVPPADFWREDRVSDATLNPAGDLLAEAIRLDDEHWVIDLVDVRDESALRLSESPAPVRDLTWADDRTLVAGISKTPGAELVTAFHVKDKPDGGRKFDAIRIDPPGNVVSAIVDSPGEILYDEGGGIYRRDVRTRSGINNYSLGDLMNAAPAGGRQWWPDGHGRLRLALAKRGEGLGLWYDDGKQPGFVSDVDRTHTLFPVGLSYDGDMVYATTEDDRAQRDLVVFDPVRKQIVRTLFSKPGIDVEGAFFDARMQPIGVMYYEKGRPIREYFDEGDKALTALLGRTFPGRNVNMVSRSSDGKQVLLQVEASDQPPSLYLLDVAARRASLLESERPWLDAVRLAPTQVVTANARDGLRVEAYLTLPDGQGKRPMVVLPHGGPVGIGDRLLFDPESQFFASLGYAVLRVNFRGSEGFGKQFREAGYKQQGAAIEDDIDAAIAAAIAGYPVDPDRMCIVGSSYGGYSALVSVLRWPDRFRCAVSVSGVSDRLLAFTANDSTQTAASRDENERIFGNPLAEKDEMVSKSPLYRYREFRAPVMLVHGREDRRVDYEHTRRFLRMLQMAGQQPVALVFDREGHGWDELADTVAAYTGIAGFLERHLDAPGAASPRDVTDSLPAPPPRPASP